MFYAHFVLAKKGPLAKIWLAAHWDKKLTKAHVFETNIEKSVDGILKPKVKMALRTSGHLLLGVVRIYSRKAKYLLADCNEAFVKIKMAFRPGMVDLPEEHREAAMNAITLPEVFHDFDAAMPELNEMEIEAQFSLNQSRAEEITMREDYGTLNLVAHDDGFGDMGFDTDQPDIMREAIGGEAALEQSNLLFADGSSLELGDKEQGVGQAGANRTGLPLSSSVLERHRHMESVPHGSMEDGFGGTIGEVEDFGHAGGLFEGELFSDVGAGAAGSSTAPGISSTQPQSLQAEIEAASVADPGVRAAAPTDADSDDDMGGHYDAAPSPQHSWDGSQHEDMALHDRPVDPAAELMPPPSVPRPPSVMPMEVDEPPPEPVAGPSSAAQTPADVPPEHDNTTLLNNDEESFALAPVDATILKGLMKTKRKRKLIVDEVKNISGEEMKNQLSNTSDIVTTLDLAPPTRRLMHWKETGGVEKLFALPARPIPSRILFKKYQRNMTLRADPEEGSAGGAPAEPEAARRSPDHEAPARRSGRKRKHEEIAPRVEPEPVPDMEPPTPVPHEYEPSIEHPPAGSQTPGYPLTPASDVDPHTPGGMLSLGPPLTPRTLLQGGLTPAGLHHGDITPGGLHHGGLTPAGLHHGDLGGMTPAGLHHGGMTPAGLHHGGMTPGLGMDGGMTPVGLGHGGLTPVGLHHGGLTPVGLHHGGMTPAGLQHGLDDHMPMMPHLPGDQVSSLLGDAGNVSTTAPGPAELDHTVPMEPLPLHGLADQPPYQSGMAMANLGYDESHGAHSPVHDDYDLPPSVEHGEDGDREAGETDEQFEERVLNRRAAQLFAVMKPRILAHTQLTFREIAPLHNARKQVAQKFYSLLVLKKYQVLSLHQNETYGELIITRGNQFEKEAL